VAWSVTARLGQAQSGGRLRSLAELIVAQFKKRGIRALRSQTRKQDALTVKPLNGMSQRRPIVLFEYVGTDLNHAVGSEADELAIESAVMERAEGESIGNRRLTQGVRVWDDVRGI